MLTGTFGYGRDERTGHEPIQRAYSVSRLLRSAKYVNHAKHHQRRRSCRRTTAPVADVAAAEVAASGARRSSCCRPARSRWSTGATSSGPAPTGTSARGGTTTATTSRSSVTSQQSAYPPEEVDMFPITYDEMRPGCWQPKERIKDMEMNGVAGLAVLPQLPPVLRADLLRSERP